MFFSPSDKKRAFECPIAAQEKSHSAMCWTHGIYIEKAQNYKLTEIFSFSLLIFPSILQFAYSRTYFCPRIAKFNRVWEREGKRYYNRAEGYDKLQNA